MTVAFRFGIQEVSTAAVKGDEGGKVEGRAAAAAVSLVLL